LLLTIILRLLASTTKKTNNIIFHSQIALSNMNGAQDAAANVESDSKPPSLASSSTTTTVSVTLPTEIRVAVGSTNPCKLQAVQLAFERVLAPRSSSSSNADTSHNPFPNIHLDIQGFHVPSLVADQPIGDDETKTGAQNRARAAYQAYKEKFNKVPHFAIGLEGGIEITTSEKTTPDGGYVANNDDDVWCMAWMAVYGKRQALLADLVASTTCHHYYGDKRPVFGLAKTASFLLPAAVANLIMKEGWELGDADDKVFGRTQSKHGAGTVGILTDFLIPRAAYYEHALILALMPWIRPDVYPYGSSS
jgi:non-canonical (house-cleaning) NTP pyrophosphatase